MSISARRAGAFAVPLLLLALATWQVVAAGPLLRWDARLSAALRHPDRFSELLSDLGNTQVAVPVLVLAAGWVAWRARRAGLARWWAAPVAALTAMALVPLTVVPLKVWTDRPGTPAVPVATGYFPSGHTATAAVAYGGAALLLLPWLSSARARRAVLWAAWVLVAAVSYGLVRRGYHWPLDVFASWCLSGVLLGALRMTLTRTEEGPPPAARRTPRRMTLTRTEEGAKAEWRAPAVGRAGQTPPGAPASTVDSDCSTSREGP